MAEPFLAEIRIFGFNFPPRGWAQCNGEQLSINQNQSLYSLLGTTYGGDGRTSFALPDLRGRVPIHRAASGTLSNLGTDTGEESVTLSESEIPAHTHSMIAANLDADNSNPEGQLLAKTATSLGNIYTGTNFTLNSSLSSSAISSTGGQPHNNMQPFLTVNFCIAMTGTFPPRN